MFGVVYVFVCVCVCGCVFVIVRVCVCASHPVSRGLSPVQQGVAEGTRVCHQRRHSRFPADTGTDHPSVPAVINVLIPPGPPFVIRIKKTTQAISDGFSK